MSKECNHLSIHTERLYEPTLEDVNIGTGGIGIDMEKPVIVTWCADCGKKIKAVKAEK